MKQALSFLAITFLLTSCINEQESLQNIHNRDLEAIEAYMRDTPIPSVRTEQDAETGLVIMWIEENPDGARPQVGDSLWVDYTGSFFDGRVFDTSYDSVAREHEILNPNRAYEPYGVALGITGFISGFNTALYNMKEGDKTVVLIPSTSAYGRTGQGSIPPNTPLRFDLHMVEVAEEEPEEL